MTIRPLERADLPAVTALIRHHVPGAFTLRTSFFAATLLDHPWADPEIPSLVAVDEEDEGAVVGFIGAQVRRMRLNERPLRAVCCSHLVVTPGQRKAAPGALLLRRLMAGPQDVTWSDTANHVVMRMWQLFGGHRDYTRCCDWMLVVRPTPWRRRAGLSLVRRGEARLALFPVEALPIQAGGRRLVRGAFPAPEAGITSEAASAASIAEHAPRFVPKSTIRADYDAAYLDHVFALIETTGSLTRRLVRRGDRPIGWYAYADRE